MTAPIRMLVAASLGLTAALVPAPAGAQTAVSVAARIGDFHVAVSNYYHVPEREIVVIRERRIPDDDLPVVLFIAQRARVAPAHIVDLRLRGLSWWDISVRYGLGPEAYYVPVRIDPGPPYGRAYGHYKKPKHQWKSIVLTDADVVHLVHLRFLSEHYGISPDRVIESRGRHGSLMAVHSEVSGRGRGHGGPERAEGGPGRGRGRGNR
jgi:hypothetical protein